MGEIEKAQALSEMKTFNIKRAKMRGITAGQHFVEAGYLFENPYEEAKEPECFGAWNEGFFEATKTQ